MTNKTNEKVACPSCEDSFDTERARNMHHTNKHGESLVTDTSVCNECGETFEYYTGDSNGEFCSESCLNENWGGKREGECDFCGEIFQYNPNSVPGIYCSHSCKAKDKTGKDNPYWNGGNIVKTCIVCENNFEITPSTEEWRKTCSKECLGDLNSERFGNENHSRWKGGKVTDYGGTWKTVRKEVREDECQMPSCEKTESNGGRELHLHHQFPIRLFDDPNDAHFEGNLLTLCAEHHVGENGIEHVDSTPVREGL